MSKFRDSKNVFKPRYGNYIGGEWVAPVDGKYVENKSPINGQVLCEVPSSTEKDVDKALDAAHKAQTAWERTSVMQRANILLKIADRLEENFELLAHAETWDKGKPIRESRAIDLDLSVDHFRYFASCIRAQEGGASEITYDSVAYHYHEPIGVVGIIVPWNFSILMTVWKIAPALAAGNSIVVKLASATPASVLVMLDVIGDLLPAGVLNVINGDGEKVGEYLATHPRIAKVAFTGSTSVGRRIMQSATKNIIPCTLELGGKSPNIFFEDVFEHGEAFVDKIIEGLLFFSFNQGENCTCPSRAIIHEKVYDRLMEKALQRAKAIKQGNPLDDDTQIGSQVDEKQVQRILEYIEIGKKEGAQLLIGGERNTEGELAKGCFVKPTMFKGNNKMRIFQEEIFGPVSSVTTFKTDAEALEIANDTVYGLASYIWTKDIDRAYRFSRGIKAGRVWVNSLDDAPAHIAFGGYKQSGIGRETHKRTLENYQQLKSVMVSHTNNRFNFF